MAEVNLLGATPKQQRILNHHSIDEIKRDYPEVYALIEKYDRKRPNKDTRKKPGRGIEIHLNTE